MAVECSGRSPRIFQLWSWWHWYAFHFWVAPSCSAGKLTGRKPDWPQVARNPRVVQIRRWVLLGQPTAKLGWRKIQDTTSHGLMLNSRLVSDCTTWQDSNVVYLSFRSTRGLPNSPRAAAKNLKSLLQADRIRFFDLQLPAWNRRKHHQTSTADDFHIIFRTFEALWQLLLLRVFWVGSTRCVAFQSWVEDLLISCISDPRLGDEKHLVRTVWA